MHALHVMIVHAQRRRLIAPSTAPQLPPPTLSSSTCASAMSASSAALQSAMFANEDGPPPPFIPTSQWAPILPGQAVPPGLWMRMDISTGVRLARLMPKDGERAAEVEGGEGAPGSAGGDPRSPVGVRDDEFDESAPAEDEGATPETFFQTFAPVFGRNEKFSKRGQSWRSSEQEGRAGCHGPQAESAAWKQLHAMKSLDSACPCCHCAVRQSSIARVCHSVRRLAV